jgi:hypothetical protein
LSEAYEVVKRLNKIGREKQKAEYDKNTKFVTHSVGDYVYLKEMAVSAGKSKKFCNCWRWPYLITKRLADLNYQIQIKPGKCVTVNVNRLKKCYDPPKKRKDRKGSVPTPNNEQSADEWDSSDDEPLHLLGRPKFILTSRDRLQGLENTGTMGEVAEEVARLLHGNPEICFRGPLIQSQKDFQAPKWWIKELQELESSYSCCCCVSSSYALFWK